MNVKSKNFSTMFVRIKLAHYPEDPYKIINVAQLYIAIQILVIM